MKHIKLILGISILLCNHSLKAQSFFIDGATYYTYKDAYSLSPGVSFASYFKEIIKLDSTNLDGEYYSVKRTSDLKIDSFTYQLKVKKDKVYYSGLLKNNNNDSFLVKDLMINDFTQKPGDSLRISDVGSGLKLKFVVDSIKPRLFPDGIARQVFYYSGKNSSPEYPRQPIRFIAKGLGSDAGLVCFKLTNRINPYWQELISICSSKQVYSNTSFSYLKKNNFCEEDSIIQMIKIIKQKASINGLKAEKYKVYPNPTNTVLMVTIIIPEKKLRVEIADFTGKIIYQDRNPLITNNRIIIDCSRYDKGFYTVLIQDDTGLFNQQFIKLD